MTDTQIFQLLGLTFFAVGLGMLVNPKFVRNISQALRQSAMDMFLGGLVSLAIGFFLVTFHNVWGWNWSVIITVMGWIALFKGLGFLIAPAHTMRMYKGMLKHAPFASYFVLRLGILALYLGYFA